MVTVVGRGGRGGEAQHANRGRESWSPCRHDRGVMNDFFDSEYAALTCPWIIVTNDLHCDAIRSSSSSPSSS